jgi:hypothetical protein
MKKRRGQGIMAIIQLSQRGGAPISTDRKTGKVRKG